MATAVRKIVRIDEEKCDGCGDCVPSCHEGAIAIIGGKARVVSEVLCDGLGACLGHCPRGAITVEERPAEAFDPAEVERLRKKTAPPAPARTMAVPAAAHRHLHGGGGCPGSAFRELPVTPAAARPPAASGVPAPAASGGSRLSHWPVQLALVPPTGPIWQDADILIAADCVPFAMAGFHERLLAGKSLAIACPKLDDVEPYVSKLAAIFGGNDIRSVTVARMEVPCCGGLVRAVEAALRLAGREDIPMTETIVGVRGDVLREVSRRAMGAEQD